MEFIILYKALKSIAIEYIFTDILKPVIIFSYVCIFAAIHGSLAKQNSQLIFLFFRHHLIRRIFLNIDFNNSFGIFQHFPAVFTEVAQV